MHSASHPSPLFTSHPPKVLVVDDSRTMRHLLISELNKLGIDQISEAGDGQAAIEMLRTESFDLMLLDMEMPILTGLEALRIIKSEPELKYLPVIIVSSDNDFEKVVECIEIGAEDYLPKKPFNSVFLRARVCSSLEKKRLRDADANKIHRLQDVGIALSKQIDIQDLLKIVLDAAMDLTHAEAGSIYKVNQDHQGLEFVLSKNRKLDFSSVDLDHDGNLPTILPFKHPDGSDNFSNVSVYSALKQAPINLPDIYEAQGFDFSGAREIDAKIGYRSRSMLVIPMIDHRRQTLGVVQLINCLSSAKPSEIIPFSTDAQRFAESLASQAAIAKSNNNLIIELEMVFESFIRMINQAIDEKSPYTGGHCVRVPEIAIRLAEACHQKQEGPLAAFHMNDADRYEFSIAALLHDCGKVTTPVHVVDKATKLETIFDRIALLDTRFEVIRRDVQLKLRADTLRENALRSDELSSILSQIDDDQAFLRKCNTGSERMSDEDQHRITAISQRYSWIPYGQSEAVPFLTTDELENLSIVAGTLTKDERAVINEHMATTIRMLEAVPWPAHLKNVVEYAGGHHERMDGKGYPKGLTGDQMSVQARIMAIADIFEALTAADRPYKKPMKLTQALGIMKRMSEEGHIDPDLYEVFISEKIYSDYGQQFLNEDQLDLA
jgi:response regulator RpfG family c-di-GMP phosphodiesterase